MAQSRSANLLSQAAFARRVGVTPMTVSRWKDAGWLVKSHGCVVVDESERRLAERVKCYRGGVARGPTAEDPAPANIYTELEAVDPNPPALRPKVPAEKVLTGISDIIGVVGRILPPMLIQHGVTARTAFDIDMALTLALVDEADGVANRALGLTKVLSEFDSAYAATKDLPDAFWQAAAADNGDLYDEDTWLNQ